MNESKNVFQDGDEFWEFVKNKNGGLGIPISATKGLDLLNALCEIREAYLVNVEIGDMMITLLGSLLVGITEGKGDQIVEEVIVSEAMGELDTNLKEILDEGH